MKATGLAAALLLAILAIPQLATAAQAPNEGITLSPINKHYDLKQGETISDTMLIVNHGKTDYDFKVFTKGYDVVSEKYLIQTDNLTNPMADVGLWVTFTNTLYHLKAGENVTIPFNVMVPQKVTPGSHTGIIYAEIQHPGAEGLVIKKSVGLVLYANVGGEYQKAGSVDDISIPFYQSSLPLRISARFLNTGTAYYIGKEEVKIYDVFGNKLTEQSKEFTVLPDRPRKVEVDFDNVNNLGLYKVEMLTKVFDQEKTTSGYVLLVPLWLIIFVPVALVGLVASFKLRKRRQVVHFKAHK